MGRRAAPSLPLSQEGFVALLFCVVMVMALANCVTSTMADLARRSRSTAGQRRGAGWAADGARGRAPDRLATMDDPSPTGAAEA